MGDHEVDQAENATGFLTAMIAGGLAGTSVDVALFPIDTLKTRLQAPGGFVKAGGFRGVYNGIGAAAAGSAPGAALFFCTYETLKPTFLQYQRESGGDSDALCHMAAASVGEAAACLVRVPTEVVKAKMQVAKEKRGLLESIRGVLNERHGGNPLSKLTGGLYRGYGITLFREVPFAIIQFPIYERLKVIWGEKQEEPVSPWQAAACGSFGGAIAAAATTPLDVLKTRLMLGVDAQGVPYEGVGDVLRKTVGKEGSMALFNGIQPRVMWISIGGFVFFGAYETFKSLLVFG